MKNLGLVEGRFCDLVWANAPVTTAQLVKLCEKELNWKRTTTYTVLKHMINRGLFENDNKTVRVLITRDEFCLSLSRRLPQNPSSVARKPRSLSG